MKPLALTSICGVTWTRSSQFQWCPLRNELVIVQGGIITCVNIRTWKNTRYIRCYIGNSPIEALCFFANDTRILVAQQNYVLQEYILSHAYITNDNNSLERKKNASTNSGLPIIVTIPIKLCFPNSTHAVTLSPLIHSDVSNDMKKEPMEFKMNSTIIQVKHLNDELFLVLSSDQCIVFQLAIPTKKSVVKIKCKPLSNKKAREPTIGIIIAQIHSISQHCSVLPLGVDHFFTCGLHHLSLWKLEPLPPAKNYSYFSDDATHKECDQSFQSQNNMHKFSDNLVCHSVI
ncbi:hypothetical protein RFI_07170 [Reticulomyxa filosa]|uniref:Uncharacterized protein n=1 Tax=Reticulomyxa filosa TaxID=46433 RepID=X6NVU8_RETFI|nr:hypothetical protein RFI_07170 [Reticulomyxa filosa]|eukprot:ETO29949.1 hypothetical protein RFI_07170 [Reticulomyxa filosa]